MTSTRRTLALVACILCTLAFDANAGYVQTNLVSSVPGLAAATDPNLKNPWGLSSSATSPIWVSDQVTGKSTLYNGAGTPQALVVTVPPANPTGQVFNAGSGFVLNGNPARFIFATLDGTIAAWNGGTTATIMHTTTGAVFTGLAIAGNTLYAADTRNNQVSVFDTSFNPVSFSAFVDPNLPSGFSIHNIQNLGGTLYATYENETTGGGVVDAFDTSGNLLRRISSNGAGGPLESPWGVALAPLSFGLFGGALLVGNEDDGRISAFNPLTGAYLGQLLDDMGNPLVNEGLWGLQFGNSGSGGATDTLYFAAGIRGETEGLFGSIRSTDATTVIPEPATALLLMAGVAALVGRRRPRA